MLPNEKLACYQTYNENYDPIAYDRMLTHIKNGVGGHNLRFFEKVKELNDACLEQCGYRFDDQHCKTGAFLHWVYWTFPIGTGHEIRDYIYSFNRSREWPITIITTGGGRNVQA